MPGNSVQIDNLEMRIAGISREEGLGIGNEVAKRVAASLPAQGKRQRLGTVTLRVNLPVGMPRDQIAMRIAMSILERIT